MNIIRHSKLVQLYFVILGLSITIITALFIMIPSIQMDMIREDYILENTTALLFFVAFILGTYFLLTAKNRKRWLIYSIIPLIALIFFLDEVSFALRLSDDAEGIIVFDYEIDGLHDIFELAQIVLPRLRFKYGDALLLLVGGTATVIGLAITFYITRRFSLIDRFRQWLPNHIPLAIFFGGLMIFLSLSVTFDNEILFNENRFTVLFEELSETCAGLSLLFCSLYLRIPTQEKLKNKNQSIADSE